MSEWKAPAELWAKFAHMNSGDYYIGAFESCEKARSHPQVIGQELVPYVPEARLAAVEAERDVARDGPPLLSQDENYERK